MGKGDKVYWNSARISFGFTMCVCYHTSINDMQVLLLKDEMPKGQMTTEERVF